MAQPRILLGTPIRNASHSLERWWNGLLNLNYPNELIDLYIIEDMSDDNTYQLLEGYRAKSPFKSFNLIRSDWLEAAKLRQPEFRTGTLWWRQDEWVSWYNDYWLEGVRSGTWDQFIQVHADCVVNPEAINTYLKVINERTDCGWVGSLGAARGGGYLTAWEWRVPNPVEAYESALRSARDIKIVEGGLGGMIPVTRIPTENPFRCAFVGTCFMINGRVIRDGCRFAKWYEEIAFPFAVDMMRRGYYGYCAKESRMVHIIGDGSEQKL